MLFFHKILNVSSLNFNIEVRYYNAFCKNFLQRVQTTNSEMTALEKVRLQERSGTTLVNGSNFTFNATPSQHYYPYPRYCPLGIN